ncbi:hypothetical protein [Marinospirillum sp.]|uniref:hypothetical protein n=1 Tax=Marinospirillum sp. TaxID=2183934 RepID=UPI0028708471|nr:hypothetical protein [Marinospirillum sp.]MDR9466791.1 hypothetical protein [Marinospirillum sp.]
MLNKTLQAAFLALTLAGVTACATQESGEPSSASEQQLFELHHDDGRIYVFDDFDMYRAAVEGNKPTYHQNRIGAGPNGETLVFGLDKDQSKQRSIDFINIYTGDQELEGSFYGELKRDNRIYIAETLEDFHSVREAEAIYHFNLIGDGPDGETLVFIQNGDTKGKPADALIAKYKKLYGK